MKDIENGHPNDKGKVWPADKKILDFVIVVAGSYFRYEKDTPSEFEIQVSNKINPTSVKLKRLKEEVLLSMYIQTFKRFPLSQAF